MLNCRIWPALMRLSLLLVLGAGTAAVAPAVARAGVVAVCADGSIILAKKWGDVNCAGAVEVAPADVPPIGSGIRPRSIAWANFLREQEAMRRATPPYPAAMDRRTRASADHIPSRPHRSVEPSLSLTRAEHRDLALLVDLSQRHSPAILTHRQAGGDSVAVLQLAHSRAFEARLHARQRAAGSLSSGPVLAFSLELPIGSSAIPPLSFVQGGRDFQPNTSDPREFGWIEGGAGEVVAGDRRLGYVALPESFELSRRVAVLWGDSVVATTLDRRDLRTRVQ